MERLDRALAVSLFALLGIACLKAPYGIMRSGQLRAHPWMASGFGAFGLLLIALAVYSAFVTPAPRFQLLGASGPSRAGTFILAGMVLFMFVAVLLSLLR